MIAKMVLYMVLHSLFWPGLNALCTIACSADGTFYTPVIIIINTHTHTWALVLSLSVEKNLLNTHRTLSVHWKCVWLENCSYVWRE